MELEVFWPNDDTESVGERLEAWDNAPGQCMTTLGCSAFLIVFAPAPHLRCMLHVYAILDAIPQLYIGAEMVAEVASNLLLHFLVSTTVAAMTTAMICSSFAPTVSVMSAMLVYAVCAPLVSVTPPALVVRVRWSSVFMWVHLIVSVWPLTEVRTSLLLTLVDSRHLALTLTSPGAIGTTTVIGSHGRSRCMSPQPVLIDLDRGGLQIGHDGIKHWELGELCELVHGDINVGAWSLVDLLVAAHVEHVS
jgi:hypothetical protein